MACLAFWRDARHFRPRFYRPVLAQPASWFFPEQYLRQARPNGWPLSRWELFCKRVKPEFRSLHRYLRLAADADGRRIVISILPRMDAALLVAAIGSTSVADIKECQKHLQRDPVVRVVVNKATETAGSYYGYY